MLITIGTSLITPLIPIYKPRLGFGDIGVTNYALVGAAGFLVLVSGAITQIVFRTLQPTPAIAWGLAVATVAFVGVVIGAPFKSAALVLASVAVTGGACGLVFKGGIDLATRIAPPDDRGKLISSYYVACYLGGFSLPLLIVGVSADLIGLTAVLTLLTAAASAWTVSIGLRVVAELPSVEAILGE